jgi:hypothetical protein
MARARRRMNQVFVSAIGACMKPPEWVREIKPV